MNNCKVSFRTLSSLSLKQPLLSIFSLLFWLSFRNNTFVKNIPDDLGIIVVAGQQVKGQGWLATFTNLTVNSRQKLSVEYFGRIVYKILIIQKVTTYHSLACWKLD